MGSLAEIQQTSLSRAQGPERLAPTDARADDLSRLGPQASEADIRVELGKLDRLEYERQRDGMAGRIGTRVSTLDKLYEEARPAKRAGSGFGKGFEFTNPAPSSTPISTDALIEKTVTALNRYLVLPEHADTAIALWVMHTWALDAFGLSPLLAIQSPQKRCGKSHLLMLLQALVRRPITAANASPAVLFRTIDAHQPTLLLDEADTWFRDNDEARGIINAGHTRKTAYTMRLVGDDFEPRQFSTWCAKAIAGIGSLRDTIEDRSIIVRMRRKAPGEKVDRLRHDRIAVPAASMFARWQHDNLGKLRGADPSAPSKLNDRAADNWRPLLAIADLAGGQWPKLARDAAMVLSSDQDDESTLAMMLLTDLRAIFDEHGTRLSSAAIVASLVSLEHRPWTEANRGKQINANRLARMLKQFGIKPSIYREGVNVQRGYAAKDCADTFNRYLPPRETVTPLQRSSGAGSGDFQTVTGQIRVTDRKRPQAARLSQCNGVTVSEPVEPDEAAV